jgi:hypothetical protein
VSRFLLYPTPGQEVLLLEPCGIDSVASSLKTMSARAMIEAQVAGSCTIPGISDRLAQMIISEIGVDMGRFPTAA